MHKISPNSSNNNATQGMQRALQKLNNSAVEIATANSPSLENITDQIEAKNEFDLNLKVAKTQNENMGTLLDLFA
jgi:hypothetical protein